MFIPKVSRAAKSADVRRWSLVAGMDVLHVTQVNGVRQYAKIRAAICDSRIQAQECAVG